MAINDKHKTVVVSLGVSRKEYPFLLNWLYMTSPGIHYVNAMLNASGLETVIVNKADENLTTDEVIEKIHGNKPEVVLFNQFFSTRDEVKRIANSLPPDMVCGVGGQDATLHSLSLSSDEFARLYGHVDFVWQGECETAFTKFVMDFKKGSGPVRINNFHNRVQDLDRLPVLKHNDYNGEMAFLVTSRGCVSNGCDFCTTPRFYPDGWRSRSADHVIEELQAIKNTGRVHINVTDDNFLGLSEGDLERALTIIRKARELGLKLYPMTSVKQILRAEKAGLLGEFTGTVPKIFLGVENSDPVALKKIGKKVNAFRHAEESARAIDALYRQGVSPYLGYINFNPETTLEELNRSLVFLHENHQEASNFHYLFNKLGIYEGTQLYEKYSNDNLNLNITDNEYHYDFNDRRTAIVYSILNFVIGNTQILDYLHFEATHLIYMNQLQETPIGKKYMDMKKSIDNINYDFFNSAIQIGRDEGSLQNILDLVDDFKMKLIITIGNYKLLIPEIVRKSTFLLHEPLKYIN